MSVASKKPKQRLPSNWRDRIEFIRISDNNANNELIEFSVRFQKGKTPKSFSKTIGHLMIYKDADNTVGEISIDDSRMKRRGLGTSLCNEALKYLGHITTYFHHDSKEAQFLWKSLCRQYNHTADFWSDKLIIRKKKRKKKRKNK